MCQCDSPVGGPTEAAPRRSPWSPARPVVPSQPYHRNHHQAPGRISDRSCVCVAGPPAPPPRPTAGGGLGLRLSVPPPLLPSTASLTIPQRRRATHCVPARRAHARSRSARMRTSAARARAHTLPRVLPRRSPSGAAGHADGWDRQVTTRVTVDNLRQWQRGTSHFFRKLVFP